MNLRSRSSLPAANNPTWTDNGLPADVTRPGSGRVVVATRKLARPFADYSCLGAAQTNELRDVLTIMERLAEADAGFRSLTGAIDTTTPAGRMMMQMVGAFAEFERAMLRERTKAGLDAACHEGRVGGRRSKLTPQQQSEIRKMVSKGRKTAADAARLFKVHPATVSRLLTRAYAK
jgi:DNA invertase Pin-like site-specific DNA recombinase